MKISPLFAEWKSHSNNLQVTNMPSIRRGNCFHYPVQSNDRLNLLNGNSDHNTYTFIPNHWKWKDIANTSIINNADSLSSFTRIKNYIWATGGLGTCGKTIPEMKYSDRGLKMDLTPRIGFKVE